MTFFLVLISVVLTLEPDVAISYDTVYFVVAVTSSYCLPSKGE